METKLQSPNQTFNGALFVNENRKPIVNYLKQIPYVLIYSRLLMAVYFILASICKPLQNPVVISVILIAGILTDIFDGITARKLKCDTIHLRQLDSKVDTVFWFSLLYILLSIRSQFIRDHAFELFVLLALEIGVQLFGYFKFNRSLALHTYAAKAWAVLLTFTVLQLLLGGNTEVLFYVMFCWGLIAQTEVLIIVYKMKTYKVDVRSVFSRF